MLVSAARSARIALTVALVACGTAESPPEPAAEAPARPTGALTSLRVLSAGVEGEYPVAHDAQSLTLHLVDGDLATAWSPAGVVRLEVAAAGLSSIELLHTGVRKLRWRPLVPEGPALRAGAWSEVDLALVALVGTGPWQRFTARPDGVVHGVELEVVDPPSGASIQELRLSGVPAAPDPAVRSTRWVAVTSSTLDGPFQRGAEQVEAVDPPRCAFWVDGVEHRGTKNTCNNEGDRVSIGLEDPDGGEPAVHEFRVREVGGCFALVDGYPYTRCSPEA